MKAQTLLLIDIMTFLVLSLIVTFASYFYYVKPFTVDAEFTYRGWPLCWMIESWSYWSQPPYPHHISFQPMNFLADFIFYAIIFQVPMQLYLYSKEAIRRARRGEATAVYPVHSKTFLGGDPELACPNLNSLAVD